MNERVKADGLPCKTCAARTPTSEGDICEPSKLGTRNNPSKKLRSGFVFGRKTGVGTP